MKKLIAFNWKMNPDSRKEAVKLLKEYSGADAVIAPPFVYLNDLKTEKIKNSKLKNLKLAAQDIFWEESGAYTGEVSPKMLKDLGVEYAIIGHSERRQYMNETDKMINKKIKASLSAGLKVILCVGEALAIRKKGKKAVENFVKKQLSAGLRGLEDLNAENLIVAYEPIWAIGTGVACDPEDARKTIGFIGEFFVSSFGIKKPVVLYGGSANSQNIKSFVQFKEIGGALVGGASLKKDEVRKIIHMN
jgi:triosephosphate isomerase